MPQAAYILHERQPRYRRFTSQRSWRSWLTRYGVSVLAVGIALGLKLLLVPLLSQDEPFLLFFAAVMASAAFGGLGPGLLATLLAALTDNYFFVAPYRQFAIDSPGQRWRLGFFFAEGVFVSIICAKLKMARKRAEDSETDARDLERRILEISDAEQRRIGHDLHDGLGQHLTGIALLSSQLEHRLAAEASAHTGRAEKLSSLAEKAVEWTHDLTRSLSPPALESEGLVEALDELAANAENIFGIECTCEHNGDVDLHDVAAAVHLYRIAQEAISNAVKHGQAKHVNVGLFSDNGDINMQITDDGNGIKALDGNVDGMGLRIMRYRAKMIGATIDVQHGSPNFGGGTKVTCRYRPVPNSQKERL